MSDGAWPGRAGQSERYSAGPGKAMKGRSVPERASWDLVWSAESDRGRKDSVRQRRNRQDRTGWSMAEQGRTG